MDADHKQLPASLRALVDSRHLQLGLPEPEWSQQWSLEALAGSIVELSGHAGAPVLTLACRLVLEAQQHQEPAVWIGRRDSCFYPPDVARAGIDLGALPVVRTDTTTAMAQAAELLLRSGAFGLVVMDMGHQYRLQAAAQKRLAGLSRQHHTVLLCLTCKSRQAPSLGTFVSLYGQSRRCRRTDSSFACEVTMLKDKRHRPGWTHEECCDAPDGLC